MKNGDKPINPAKKASGHLFNSSKEDEHYIKATGPFLGLTKREYFAGLAMQGILSNNTLFEKLLQGDTPENEGEQVCKSAIWFADELLKQLEK